MLARNHAWTLSFAMMLVACGGTTPADSGTPDNGTGSDGTDITARDTGTDAGGQDVAPDTGTCGTGYGPCNPVTNAGCTGGQACILAGTADGGVTTVCQTAGTGGYGSACGGTNPPCLEGFACLGGGTSGVCQKLCCGIGDDGTCRTGTGGQAGAVCNVGIMGVSFFACTPAMICDWFAENCPGGQNCEPINMMGTTTCIPVGTAAVGAPCGGASGAACVRGATCIDPGICRAICNPMALSDAGAPDGGISPVCPSTATCQGVNNAPTNYGVCIPGDAG